MRECESHLLFNQTKDKMVQCAIEGCSSRSDTQPSGFMESAVHFHRIPRATLIRQKWIQAINKREVKTSTRVCSLHFKKENYYITKQGFHKLTGGSVPEIKLPVEQVVEDSSSDEEMTNVLAPEPNISYQSQTQQTNTKEIMPEFGTTVNVLGSTNIKHLEDAKDDTTDSSCDDEMSNVQNLEHNVNYHSQSQQSSTKENTPEIGTRVNILGSINIKHGEEVNSDATHSSEDEKMSNMQPQEQNINHPNQPPQNNFKEITTDNVRGSSTIKPGVQKHKVKTLLERKLLKEVRRLQEEGKKRMQAINCLLEQNRRLLDRNSFLEQAVNNSKKGTENVINVAQQESIFFKFN